MTSFAALRDRFVGDHTYANGAAPGLTRALEHVGWRSVGEPTSEELASHIALLVEACVVEHHDVDALTHQIALTLRQYGPTLDGGLPPTEAYLSAADEVVREYVSPSQRPGFGWSPGWTVE